MTCPPRRTPLGRDNTSAADPIRWSPSLTAVYAPLAVSAFRRPSD
jgi:hypothetical protein